MATAQQLAMMEQQKKKPLGGFDAFFAAVDSGATQEQAQQAFSQNALNNGAGGMAVQPQQSNSPGFDAFFKAVDAGATAQGAQQAFNQNVVNGAPAANTFNADGSLASAPPPPPPPPATQPALFSSPRGLAPGTVGTGGQPAPVLPPAQLDDYQRDLVGGLNSAFQSDLNKMIASGNFNLEDLGRGFRNSGGPSDLNDAGRAEASRLLRDFEAQLQRAQAAKAQDAATLTRQTTQQGATVDSNPTTVEVSPIEQLFRAQAPGDQFARATGGSSDRELREQQMQLLQQSIDKGEGFAKDAIGGLRDFNITESGLQFQKPNASSRDVELDRFAAGITGGIDPTFEQSGFETSLQDILLGRLNQPQGAGNALTSSLLADIDAQASRQREQDMATLSRLGVLNSGNTVDLFEEGNQNVRRDRLAALAQGAALNQNDPSLEAAMQLLGMQNSRALDIGNLTGRFGGVDTLAARTAQADRVLAGREQDLSAGLANQGADMAAQRLNLETQLGIADRQLADAARRSGDERFASDLGMRQLGLQQDLADRVTGRQLIQGDVTAREQFEEDVRRARVGEGQFQDQLQNTLDQITTQGGQNRLLQQLVNSGNIGAINAQGRQNRDLQGDSLDFQRQLATGQVGDQRTLEGLFADEALALQGGLRQGTIDAQAIANSDAASQIGERQIGQLIALGEALKGNDQLATQLEGINPFKNFDPLFNSIFPYGTGASRLDRDGDGIAENLTDVDGDGEVTFDDLFQTPAANVGEKDNSVTITTVENQLRKARLDYRDAQRDRNPTTQAKAQAEVKRLERELKRLRQGV